MEKQRSKQRDHHYPTLVQPPNLQLITPLRWS